MVVMINIREVTPDKGDSSTKTRVEYSIVFHRYRFLELVKIDTSYRRLLPIRVIIGH